MLNLGDAYLQLERREDARNILTHSGTFQSDDAKIHQDLYLKPGMRDEAYREHKVLQRLDPSLADAFGKLLDTLSYL